MANILKQGQLGVLSQLLRVRLANRAIMDVNIISWKLLQRPIELDQYHGRFLGCFVRRPNGSLCFLLMIRTLDGGNFDTVYSWYVNQEIYKIPESEKTWFLQKLREYPHMGVIIVKTTLIKSCFPSALLFAIETGISLQLATKPRKRLVTHLAGVVSFRSSNSNASLPHCSVACPREDTCNAWQELQSSGLNCADYNCHSDATIPREFDVLRARYKGHWYYCLPFQADSLLLVIICHDAMIRPQDVDDFKTRLAKGFGPVKPQHLYAARFKSTSNLRCGDPIILQACANLRAFPLLIIRDEDVKCLVLGEGLEKIPNFGIEEPEPAELPLFVPDNNEEEVDVVGLDGDDFADNQETTIQIADDGNISRQKSPNEELRNPGEELQNHISSVIDTDETIAISPRDDPYGQLLLDREFAMTYIAGLSNRIAEKCSTSMRLVEPLEFEGLRDIAEESFQENRFLLVPLFTFDLSALLVIDSWNKQVGIMNPSKLARAEFQQYVSDALVALEGYTTVDIKLTLSFHAEFQLAHLLAGLIHLAKAWDYALLIPQRLVYKEQVFRKMCAMICKEQEKVNQQKNIADGLVGSDGSLLTGAFRTFSSPVQVVHCPVKTDQCLFCGKRYSKNLGSHMKMMHGKLAQDLRGRQVEELTQRYYFDD